MTRIVHANCFIAPAPRGGALLSDEPAVIAGAPLPAIGGRPERLVDPQTAHAASVDAWRVARTWFLRGGEDVTRVAGVSAGDLAGLEAAITILLPAVRGALAMAAWLDAADMPDDLESVRPVGTPMGSRYDATEAIAAEAAIAVLRARVGSRVVVTRTGSADPRNATLRDKYARTRDAEFLLPPGRLRTMREATFALCGLIGARRGGRRGSWVVVEYNPTRAFSDDYRARASRRRLIRWQGDPLELAGVLWAGDLPAGPVAEPARPATTGVSEALSRSTSSLDGAGLTVADVALWPVVADALIALADRYAAYAAHAAPRVRGLLRRCAAEAVLVPYDNDPAVRVLVRCAQAAGIPVLSINDGFKSDEIQVEGLSSDHALAWSPTIAERYFARHPGGVTVTGNPRARRPSDRRRGAQAGPLRVLVGSFTFSGVDLNCRRGDAEDFLDEILDGIDAAMPAVAGRVVVKLHPADEASAYARVLARHPRLEVEIVSAGDVMAMLDLGDVYVTTYSTSLLEAATEMPVVYYRINHQQIGLPFDDDPWLARRTASSPDELIGLLTQPAVLRAGPPDGWIERHLGHAVGAADRIAEAVEQSVSRSGSRADALRTAPGGARRR